MKKTALILSVIMIISLSASAQDYTGKARIQGVVMDDQGKPIEAVKVKLFFTKTETGFETVTDSQGIWKASWIKGGTWNIDFEKLGYAPKKISAQILDTQKNATIETKMKKMEGLILTDELKKLLTEGNTLFEQKKYDEAAAAYSLILQKFPDAYIIHLTVGNCYFQLEKYAEAETAYQKLLEKDANNSSAIVGIGNTWAYRKDGAKALEWYRKIDFEKLNDPTVLYNVGTYLYNGAQYEEALKFYKKAVDVQEDFLDAIYQLGLAYLTTQKKDEAIAVFEKYLTLDAASDKATQVRNFLDYLKKK
jgi:tetratricopeptide (TPR) repeat protein